MGRAPCCDKANVKKGPWSPEEDAKLKSYIEQHGTGGNWIALPQKIGLKRCGKSCRLRWLNYLRPNIRHGGFSEEEDNIICSLFIGIGSRWSIIAAQLPGRTDNDIKNYWNTKLKKKLLGKQRRGHQSRRVKQETEKGGEEIYSVPTGFMNQAASVAPYWPEVSPSIMPYPDLLDQGSFPQDNQVVMYENFPSMSTTPSSATCSYVSNSPYDVQGFENFSVDLTDMNQMMYGNGHLQPQFDEFGNFYGVGGSSGRSSSVESSSWGDINSLAYPQILSGFENGQQSMPQVSNF